MQSKDEKPYGLFYSKSNQPVHLKRVNFVIEASYHYSKMTQELEFKPSESNTDALVFIYPRRLSMVYSDLEIVLDGQLLKGTVLEKLMAISKFNDAKVDGHTGAVVTNEGPSHKNEQSRQDCLKVEFCNLISGSEVIIRFSVVQKIIRSDNMWWINIPSSITHLYHRTNTDAPVETKVFQFNTAPNYEAAFNPFIGGGNNSINLVKITNNLYPAWSISVNIKSACAEFDWKCNLPGFSITNDPAKIMTGLFREYKFTNDINGSKQALPQDNFEFGFKDSFYDSQFVNLCEWPSNDLFRYALSVRMDITSALETINKHSNLIGRPRVFIFLLDRSGSMQGICNQMASEALNFAIKSLPEGSFFNIYSFGSEYTRMFNVAVIADKINVEAATSDIQKNMHLNMGGTEIFLPIKAAYEEDDSQGRKVIFLLTDGQVSNTQDIIDYVRDRQKSCQVFSLGIGNAYSEELVEGVASAGNGAFEIVTQMTGISTAVVNLLEKALSFALEIVAVEFKNMDVDFSIPSTAQPGLLNFAKAFEMQLLIKDIDWSRGDAAIALKVRHKMTDIVSEFEIPVSKSLLINTSAIHKIVANEMCRHIGTFDDKKPSFYRKNKTNGEDLVDIGLGCQFLNKNTAFLVVRENLKPSVQPTQFYTEKTVKKEEIKQKPSQVEIPAVKNSPIKNLKNPKIEKPLPYSSLDDGLAGIMSQLAQVSISSSSTNQTRDRMKNKGELPVSPLDNAYYRPESHVDRELDRMMNMNDSDESISVEENTPVMIDLFTIDDYELKTVSVKIEGKSSGSTKQYSSNIRWSDLFELMKGECNMDPQHMAFKHKSLCVTADSCSMKDIRICNSEELSSSTGHVELILVDLSNSEKQKERLMKIINLQQADGHWNYCKSLIKYLEDNSLLKSSAKIDQNSAGMTRAIIDMLRLQFTSHLDDTRLIIEKANSWLSAHK